MTNNIIENEGSLIGEFIEVPAWNIIGQVIDEAPTTHGSDGAIRVLLLADPRRPARISWFRLEPAEFVLV